MLLRLFERMDRSRVTPILLVPDEGLLTEGARDLGVETLVVPVSPALLDVARGGAGSPLGAVGAVAALPAAAVRLARAISRAQADVVVTNSTKAHVYGSLAGRLARRPVVWRIHDTMDSPDFSASARRLLLGIGRRIPVRVLPVSDSTGRPLIEGGIPAERVTTLYNGIDLAALRSAAELVPARSNGVVRVGSVGRITPLKGHAVVIDAAARMLERGVQVRFVIAGALAREAPDHLQGAAGARRAPWHRRPGGPDLALLRPGRPARRASTCWCTLRCCPTRCRPRSSSRWHWASRSSQPPWAA